MHTFQQSCGVFKRQGTTKLDDLIAQQCCFLELQFLGRVLHLLFKLFNHLEQLVLGNGDITTLADDIGRLFFGYPLELVRQIPDLLNNTTRLDTMLPVVGALDIAATLCFFNRQIHRASYAIRIHDDGAVHMACCPPNRLDQRGGGAQIAFFVGIQDRNQGNLGQVQSFTQQVDTYHHIINAQPQIAQDLHPLDRIDIGVQILGANAHFLEIICQILGHALG